MERLNLTNAEPTFVTEDAYRGLGRRRKLVEATIECAQAEGITRLLTSVLRSNYRMRRLARDHELLAARLSKAAAQRVETNISQG